MANAQSILTEQMRLLRIEYEDERREFSARIDRAGLLRLVASGRAWFPVRIGRVYINSLNNTVVEVFNDSSEADDLEADHGFESGKPVCFFTLRDTPGTPAGQVKMMQSGNVSFVDGTRMAVTVPDSADTTRLAETPYLGITLSFDETSYRTMFDALERVMRADGRLGVLRDLFYSRRPAGRLSLPHLAVPYLNGAQQAGVNNVLAAKDVAIVHGPPGTGKTTTLVEAIAETLRRESQVLVCAQTNVAVDWIAEQLVDRGINVVRIGNPVRVNDKMLSFTYERRFESHPDYPTLWSLRKAMRQLRGQKRTDGWHNKMDRLQSRAVELEIRINADILGTARVIASTLVGSANKVLDGMHFSSLFIDEAAQALEAATWIPMRRAGRVILAGDHCQLPPTVKSYTAMRQGLGKSLMERLVENHPEAVTLLTTQYRMHADIMRFSSEVFYDGRLKAARDVAARGILDWDTPIEWIDTAELSEPDTADIPDSADIIAEDYSESTAHAGIGRVNKAEAKLTLRVLQDYVTRIGKQRFLDERLTVAVISPYRAQVHYLRRCLRTLSFFRPLRGLVTVNTIDGFQGQERDIVVISMVRANDEGQIGFLRDLRRMNVAITRARMKLIIVGNSGTLCRHPFYRALAAYIRLLNQ